MTVKEAKEILSMYSDDDQILMYIADREFISDNHEDLATDDEKYSRVVKETDRLEWVCINEDFETLIDIAKENVDEEDEQ